MICYACSAGTHNTFEVSRGSLVSTAAGERVVALGARDGPVHTLAFVETQRTRGTAGTPLGIPVNADLEQALAALKKRRGAQNCGRKGRECMVSTAAGVRVGASDTRDGTGYTLAFVGKRGTGGAASAPRRIRGKFKIIRDIGSKKIRTCGGRLTNRSIVYPRVNLTSEGFSNPG
jgi:hypothetical protein